MNSAYSVGIPARNEASGIVALLDALLVQSIPPGQVIVCVNGCSDNTLELASDFAGHHSSVEVITSDPGKANAWHAIVAHATNDKIMFCDGDVWIDRLAGEKLLDCFVHDDELILAGGTVWTTNHGKTWFSKYCVAVEAEPPEPKWVAGALYMLDKNKLIRKADKVGLELMPRDIINEDGFLELVTDGHNTVTREAFVRTTSVDSFRDWKSRYVRILAGRLQLDTLTGYLPRSTPNDQPAAVAAISPQGKIARNIDDLKQVYRQSRGLNSFTQRIGVRSLAIAKIIINLYYKMMGGPYVKTTWDEAKSTKNNVSGAAD